MGRVTVVGQAWARPGARFFNEQPCEAAPSCPVARACQTLPFGRRFEVTQVRPVRHGVCTVHEGGGHVVEVEPLPVEASLDVAKTRGTMASWSPPVCHHRGCPHWSRCFPPDGDAGRDYLLDEVGPPLACPMGYALVAVRLRARP